MCWSYPVARMKAQGSIIKVKDHYARPAQGRCARSRQRMPAKLQCKGASLTIVGGGSLLFGQQQARLSASHRVVHWVCVMGLEVCQALDVDAVGDDTNDHGCQYGHVIQHPDLTTSLLYTQGCASAWRCNVTGRHGSWAPQGIVRSKQVCRAYKL